MSTTSAWHTTVSVVKRTASDVGRDNLITHAAAVAFYAALSFAPIMVLLLWVVTSLQPAWQQQLIGAIKGVVGPQASSAIELIINNAEQRPHLGSVAGLIGLLVTLIGASTVFAQLQLAINRMWNLKPRPGNAIFGWLLTRLHALGLLLTLAFLMIISLVASTAINVVVHGDTLLWQIVELVVGLVVFGLVFASIFKVLPDARINWSETIAGGVFTAVLFTLGKYAISFYLSHANVGGAYGPAGGVVVLLVWVYYSVVILLLGAELTQAYARVKGVPIRPDEHATREADCPEK